MITFYVDVYFLLNFLVDIIALWFAVSLVRLNAGFVRLVLLSLFLSLYAVLTVIVDIGFIIVPLSIGLILLVGAACAPRCAFKRKLKASLAFLVFQALIGGVVYFGYCVLERLVSETEIAEVNAPNRKLIIIALLILLAITVIKIIFLVFNNSRSERSASFLYERTGRRIEFSALIDTANLVRDPFDGTAVMFVSKKLFSQMFGIAPEDLSKSELLSDAVRKRIRVIPISDISRAGLVFGIRSNEIYICSEKKRESVPMIIAASDTESYGGYPALAPSSVLEAL